MSGRFKIGFKLVAFIALCLVELFGVSRAAIAQDYSITDLKTLGGAHSAALGINKKGQVVGIAQTAQGAYHAFLYEGNAMQDLGTLGGANSLAYRINDSGQIAGFSQTSNGEVHAFIYGKGIMRDLGPLPSSQDINFENYVSGKIFSQTQEGAGALASASKAEARAELNKLISSNSGWILIEAHGSNESGQIVGYGFTRGQVHAFRQIHAFLLTPVTDLSITNTASSTWPFPGSKAVYTLTVRNNGVKPAVTVIVTDTLAPQTSLVSCAAEGEGVPEHLDSSCRVTFPFLAAGASENVKVVVTVSSQLAEGTNLVNTATVSSQTLDPNLNDNSMTASLTFISPPVTIKAGRASLLQRFDQMATVVQTFNHDYNLANSSDFKLQSIKQARDAVAAGNLTAACDRLVEMMKELKAQSIQATQSDAAKAAQLNQLTSAAYQMLALMSCR